MREFFLLNSSDSFLVSPFAISSEVCVMYSSVISATNVFCDWLFLVISCVSLETAANSRLFLNVAILSKRKSSTVVKTEPFFYFSNEFLSATACSFFFNEELDSNQ